MHVHIWGSVGFVLFKVSLGHPVHLYFASREIYVNLRVLHTAVLKQNVRLHGLLVAICEIGKLPLHKFLVQHYFYLFIGLYFPLYIKRYGLCETATKSSLCNLSCKPYFGLCFVPVHVLSLSLLNI